MTDTEDLATVPANVLRARVNLAGWQPADIRRQANQVLAGTHPISGALPLDAVTATADAMLREADRVEANGPAAAVELERRAANAPKITRGRIA